MIKVKGKLSGDGAVESGFQKCGESVMFLAAIVVSANPCDAAEHCLPTIAMLHRRFPEEE